MKNTNQKGFLLISLIIVLAIIVLILAIEYGKSRGPNGTASVLQTGQQAEEQVKQENAVLQQQHTDELNQINSVDSSPQADHNAIQQAKNAMQQQNAGQ